jgi:hypothetical protein
MSREKLQQILKGIYRFLPVQLLFLHFRKYQLLLVFWLILVLTITGNFADTFGASTLFLSPEYLGEINFFSMMLLGGAMAVFIMAWHITTFIIHSQRVPFMGATRHSFLKFCINNSILPLVFLVFYSIVSIRFQYSDEHAQSGAIWLYQLGFYLGLLFIITLSFAYFFRVDRDLLKVLLSRITNPARIRHIIPYDSLDYEIDIIRADTYLSGRMGIKKCAELEPYHPRFLQTVLRRHHRNAITATIFAILMLLLLGIFMEDPRLRIPAGAGFLILFSIIMGMVGAVKYFLRSWETIGWLLIALLLGFLVKEKVFDFRGIAFGMDYSAKNAPLPQYNYTTLKNTFTPQVYQHDKQLEEQRLDKWKAKRLADGENKPPLVVVCVSGGGTRAAYWAFNSLQHIDSLTGEQLFEHTVLVTGASGGMIGAAYWRELHNAYAQKKLDNPYAPKYRQNIGKDLLNAIVFSFASVDMISPFNKISLSGYSYSKDRGYAMEQELISNTEGMLDRKIGDYHNAETNAEVPAMIINSTIVNDGRRLMISPLPIAYLTQPAYGLSDTDTPPIDAIDYGAFFKNQNPYNMRITTALRINATFPFILPVVRMPSVPNMNLMDAGLRDNFGMEVATRYLYTMRDWIAENISGVILLEIRDTREHEVFPSTDMNTLGKMVTSPLFVIQDKWEPFQSYYHGYIKDFAPFFLGHKLRIITMNYIPETREKAAALNFHLTSKEKIDIRNSIYKPFNVKMADTLVHVLNTAQ